METEQTSAKKGKKKNSKSAVAEVGEPMSLDNGGDSEEAKSEKNKKNNEKQNWMRMFNQLLIQWRTQLALRMEETMDQSGRVCLG